jgi:predicted nicotinamide N-methyase
MDPTDFVRQNTAITAPPLVPEIRLHLATEVTPIWQATEESLARNGLPPPFWAFAWAGGQSLARYVLDHPETVAGREVLDFGSGSGLVAIAAAKAGAARATADNLLDGDTRFWKLVTTGDICYEQPMAERAMRWLRRLAGRGSTVLLGDPGRAYLPTAGLCELARYDVPTSRELEGAERFTGFVWRVLPNLGRDR